MCSRSTAHLSATYSRVSKTTTATHATYDNMSPEKLISRSFCYISAANFLLFFAFYAIMPILPFYLHDTFGIGGSATGLILASYSVACIIIRPISGYLLDTFRQRPLYLLGYFAFMAIFCGYVIAAVLSLFILFRVLHGFAFGLTTVSGNTIVTEIVPQNRIGEALGYYGLANTLAMCTGPVFGLFMHRHFPYASIFICTLAFCLIGFIMAAKVGVPHRESQRKSRFSFDNLFLTNGIWAAVSLLLASVPYGMTTAYIAVYAEEISISGNSGLFFTFMAIGLGISRLLAGKLADKGNIAFLILMGLSLVSLSFLGLFSIKYLTAYSSSAAFYAYIGIALIQGVSFGILHPAFNTLFVRLTTKEKRGAATSTYLTSWDLGIGIGIFIGGYIAQTYGGFYMSYLFGGCLAISAVAIFAAYCKTHKNRQTVPNNQPSLPPPNA